MSAAGIKTAGSRRVRECDRPGNRITRQAGSMRIVVAEILAIVLQAVLAVASAAAGVSAGFHLLLPSAPYCGLAVLPAVLFGGGVGGLVGLAVGLAIGAALKGSLRGWIAPA